MKKEDNLAVDFKQLGTEFQHNLTDFIEYTDGLSKNSLKRLINALAANPLEPDLVELVHEDEIEAFNIGVEIQSIKVNMIVESLQQEALARQEPLKEE